MLAGVATVNANPWNFGVEAGYARTTLDVSEYNASPRNGFKVGVLADYTLPCNFTFGAGIAYIRKGATVSGEHMHGYDIDRVEFAEMDYLQLPVTFLGYNFKFGSFSIKPAVGAYVAVGVNGDSFVTGHDSFNQPYTARVCTFSGESSSPNRSSYRPCDRVDGGLTFALNVAYKHFGIKAEYDLGLVNSTHYGNGKQRSLSLSLVYTIF